jgi:hypothetical protein
MTLAARAGAAAFAAGVGAALLALLLLAVGSPDGRVRQDLPLPPDGLPIASGAALELPLELPAVPGQYRLMVRCAVRGPCTSLRVAEHSAPDGRPPEGLDDGRPYFQVRRAQDWAGRLRITNAGAERVTVVRASIRNFAANGDNVPRFVVFLDDAARRPYGWPLRVGLLVAGLGLQAAGLAAWGVGRDVGVHSLRALAIAVRAVPVRLTGTPGAPAGPPPEIGEHTDAILAEAGLSAPEIARLRQAGVVR